LNIIPINVHAMMREIPLVNIYNYALTFDQMAEQLIGAKIVDDPARASVDINSSAAMLVNLIGDPYMPITTQQYGSDYYKRGQAGFVHRLFRGDSEITGLSRPKFLSDQVFNKALFGNLVPYLTTYDESGVAASSAIARGRQEHNYKDGKVGLEYEESNLNAIRLTFIDRSIKSATVANEHFPPGIGSIRVEQLQRVGMDAIGKIRFDTKLVRNIFFITNVLRILRLKLERELTQYHSVVTRGNGLVNPSITEYDRDNFGTRRSAQYETLSDARDHKYMESRK
jgi:hypothetical protein